MFIGFPSEMPSQNQQPHTDASTGGDSQKMANLESAQRELGRALDKIKQLEEMRVINEEMLEEYKEQQKKVEEELSDQQTIVVKQLEYQLEEKDRMVEKLEFALVKFRNKIDELNKQLTRKQEELDNQMSAAEMIDRLTSKSLDLEEQRYKFEIADLEEMHQLNEAIIEGKEDTEKALKQQLDEQMIAISNLKINEWEDRAVDYERVIVKFRQKTTDLNERVQSLQDELATMHARDEEKARNALTERAYERKKEDVEADKIRLQLAKKDEELFNLQKALKERESEVGTMRKALLDLQKALKERESAVGTMRVRVEMAKAQLAESTSKGGMEMELLRQRSTGFENDLKRQKEEYEQQLEQLRQQLAEEHNRTREFSKKALFANMQNQQQQQQAVAAMNASPVTPLSRVGSSSAASTMFATDTSPAGTAGVSGGDASSVAMMYQQQLDTTQQELTKALNKIRQLESQHFPDLGTLPCPNCTERTRTEQNELSEMLKESEELVKLSNKYQLRPIDVMEFSNYRKIVDNINFRSESLRIRFQRWWRMFHPGEPMPEIRLR